MQRLLFETWGGGETRMILDEASKFLIDDEMKIKCFEIYDSIHLFVYGIAFHKLASRERIDILTTKLKTGHMLRIRISSQHIFGKEQVKSHTLQHGGKFPIP